MARSSIFQSTQIGVETTSGTGVAANKRLTSVGVNFNPNIEFQITKPAGYKYPTLAAPQREWTDFSYEGGLTYTELVYVLSSVLKTATPTGTVAKTWAFTPSSTAADTVKTFTIEQGDGTLAREFSYGLFTDCTITVSRSECSISGSGIGQAVSEGITMTANPTDIALIPVLGSQAIVKLADTYAGLGAASALTGAFSATWSIGNRFSPFFWLNQSTSFAEHLEVEPTLEVTLLAEANSTVMGLLTTARAGSTKYMRIEATGAVIDGSDTYLLQIDTACKVTDVGEFSDQDGVHAIEWTFGGFHDSTLGGATKVTVVNALASL